MSANDNKKDMKKGNGTCLQDTYRWLMATTMRQSNCTIIHALVTRISDELVHPHAVIYEKETNRIHEISNSFKGRGKNVVLPFEFWKNLGNVTQIKHYTAREMTAKLLETKMWDFYHLTD